MQELGHEERHEGEDAEAVPARAPSTGVDAGADDGQEGEVAGDGVVVQFGRGGEHGHAHDGQQGGGDRLSAHGRVGDGEQGEQRGEAAGDGACEGVSGESADHHRQSDAEDGPRGEAQPRPSRVRSHEHPLQHCCPPLGAWVHRHRKGAAGSAAPSTRP